MNHDKIMSIVTRYFAFQIHEFAIILIPFIKRKIIFMEEKKTTPDEGSNSNIIFGTSSDDIQQGLHNNQFIDTSAAYAGGDKDQIVNEEEQNEIVNPSEETLGEEPAPQTVTSDAPAANEVKMPLEENSLNVESDDDQVESGNISTAEN